MFYNTPTDDVMDAWITIGRRTKPSGPYCFLESNNSDGPDDKDPCDLYSDRIINTPYIRRPITTESIYSLTNPPIFRRKQNRAAK